MIYEAKCKLPKKREAVTTVVIGLAVLEWLRVASRYLLAGLDASIFNERQELVKEYTPFEIQPNLVLSLGVTRFR